MRGGDRSVIFISHRMIEIAAICDRATVLREGETVGVVDVTAGSEERIVELMLGEAVEELSARQERGATDESWRAATPRLSARDLSHGTRAGRRHVRPAPGRGARRRRARGAGPGRAVRHPRRIGQAKRRRDAGRRQAGPLRPSGGRHPRRRRLRRRRSGRGAADAAIGAREHRPPIPHRDQPVGPDQHRRRAQEGRPARSARSRSTLAPSARCVACRAATSRRSPSPAGSRAACARCSASIRRAASTSAPRRRSTRC